MIAYLTDERASVIDCQDASAAGVLDTATGVIVRAGAARTSVGAVVRKNGRGQWLVAEARYLPDPLLRPNRARTWAFAIRRAATEAPPGDGVHPLPADRPGAMR